MAIPPNIKLRLDQLKAQAAMKAEMERRRAQAQENAQKSAQSLVPQQKANGGLVEFLKDSAIKHRMYHGTQKSFSQFKENKIGHWFSPHSHEANRYAGKDEGAKIYPVFVNVKNPLVVANSDEYNAMMNKAWSQGLRGIGELAQQNNHDGILIKDSGYLNVFHPHQIKSAIGNSGAYDPKDPDITKATGGEVKTPSTDAMRLMLNKQGMYSPLEKSLMAVPRAKGTPAEFMAEASKQPGFRAEEVADRKIALPQQKMTKAQMLSALQQNHPMPQVEVMIKGGANEESLKERAIEIAYDEARKILGPEVSNSPYGPSAVQEMANSMLNENMRNYMNLARDEMGTEEGFHDDYTLPGGENYREILLKKPEFKGYNKIRNLELDLNRVPPEKRSAIMRQIDALKTERERHGEVFPGNPSHFGGEPAILASIRVKDRRGPNGEKILHVEEIQSDWHQKGRKEGYRENKEPMDPMKAQRMKDKIFERFDAGEIDREQRNALLDQLGELQDNGRKVPDAPFKKSWHEMALKHVLGMAAKGGYDGIAITPGAEQADRYDLSKHIGEIAYDPIEKRLAGKNHEGKLVVGEENVTPEKLADYIGKEAAEKIMQAQPSQGGVHRLSGLDLKVGGEGMKGFYDKIVPTYLNKLAKPHGVQVQMNSMPIKKGEKMVPDQAGLGQIRSGEPELANLHYLPINDAMRNKIKTEGLPQYRDGGGVQNFDNGGAAFGVFPQMTGRRSQQNPQASADVPMALARGTVAGLGGTLGDIEQLGRNIVNWSFGPGGVKVPTTTYLPTSSDVEKVLPFQSASQTPVGQAATTLGELVGGGLSGPATKTLAELPGTLKLLGKEFPVQTGMAGPAIPIGEKSPMFDKLAKLKAERMERAGATPEEIKAATGIERGYDGMWRQEQSMGDLSMRTAEEIAQMGGGDLKAGVLMSKAFDENPLLSAYPDVFQNMYIARDPSSKSYFIPPSEGYAGKIMIGGSDDPARILAHEATHLVQQTEGFAPGTSRMAASEAASYPEILAQVKANPDAYYRGVGLTPEEKASYDWYRRQAGEVEARAAEARMNMTPEERRASLISSTADIPKEKVLTDAYGYEAKPVVNVGPVPVEQQTAISAADVAGQVAPEVQDRSILDAFTGGGDQEPSDLSSFFNLMGAAGPTDMSSLFGGADTGYEGEDFAEGGSVGGPTVAQMKLALMKMNPANIKNLGVNEVLGQDPKMYLPPDKQVDSVPPPGGVATPSGMPIGGVDMSQMQPGQQLMPQNAMQPQGGPQQPPGAPQAPGGAPAPAAAPGAPQGGQSNILQMTPQGRAMAALGGQQPQPPQPGGMAKGGQPVSSQKYQDLLRRHLSGERLSKDQNMLLGLYNSVGGGKKLSVPIHMMSAQYAPDPNQPMVPEHFITPEDLHKGAGLPLVGDSSRGGELLTHVGGKKFRKPVELQSGKDFMRLIKPAGEEAGWASGTSVISDLANKTRLASEFGDKVYGLHATMLGTGADFSSMPTKTVLQMIDRSKIAPAAMDAFDAEMRSIFPKFKGIRSPALSKQLLAPGAAEMRKTFLQRMNLEPFQEAGFPDVAHARVAVSHPHLLERPVHSIGAAISELDPTGRVIKNPSKPHYDYPDHLAQKRYAGGFDVPMHRGEIFQEWEKNRRMFNATPSSDPRSFDLSTPVQKFDQEWLDKVMPIYLARRKAILGKKKGGTVGTDAMRLALTKTKKAK